MTRPKMIVLDLNVSDAMYLTSYLRNTVENHPSTLGTVGCDVFTNTANQIEAQNVTGLKEYNVNEVRARLDKTISELLATPAQTHDHCDHGTNWNAPCWACNQEGPVLCTGCDEGEK